MKLIYTSINDLIIVEPNVYGDNRGWFSEAYNEVEFQKNNINIKFIQDNHSYSSQKGVLRGLHLQKEPYAQTKLVRCTRGRIWDVAVDLRKSSSTYLKWFGVELTAENHKMLLVPQGFAHGFVTLEADCEVQYKVDNVYNKDSDRSIKYNDLDINVEWPITNVIISDKDKNAPTLIESDVDFK
ncbi:MAG: dTDP-4-dehydrorhamnose 3,5-epimerase [Firmicutes bacterium]|nr:dTDP-4-dehydrorhamnose 3,5-epimerase [Bacillota bacterium]